MGASKRPRDLSGNNCGKTTNHLRSEEVASTCLARSKPGKKMPNRVNTFSRRFAKENRPFIQRNHGGR
eukprot:9731798-Prorocentrum_lima.AAC.1